MPQITIKTTPNVQLVAKKLEDFAADIPKVSKGRMYGRMMAAHKRITTYPPLFKGTLPKNWYKSDKQRRYVMMLVRQGRVPYQRTGNYMDVWHVEALPNDTGYRLKTGGAAEAYSKYVGGDAYGKQQAKIHQGRWPVAAVVVQEEMEKLPPEIVRELTSAIRRRGLA